MFQQNISVISIFNNQSFNDTLTNDIVSFEQRGPVCISVQEVPSEKRSTLKGKNLLP